MVLQKLWVSQNFRIDSRVSQSRLLSRYVHLAVSIFFTKQSCSLDFLARLRKSRSNDLFVIQFYKWNPNVFELNVSSSHFKLFEVSVRNWISENVSGSQTKTLVSPYGKVSHLPFATLTVELQKDRDINWSAATRVSKETLKASIQITKWTTNKNE